MPIKRVQFPDGSIHRIEVPDGATNEQIVAFAQSQHASQPASPAVPKQPQPEQVVDPSEGGSTLQFATPWKTYDTGIPLSQGITRGLAGVGKSIVDTGEGLGQLAGIVSQGDVDRRRELDAPLMATGAGTAGNVLGQIGQMAIPVGGGAKAASYVGKAAPYLGAAARAAGFTATQPMATGQNRGVEAAKSGAFGVGGQALATGVGAVARGAASHLDEAGAALARKADEFGLRLGVPEISENTFIRTVASQMERLPFSGATKRAAANQGAFNRQVAQTFGAKTDKITPDVFATARNRLSNGFETLTARNNLALSPDHVAQLKSVIDEAQRLGGDSTAKQVRGWANELLGKVDAAGNIPGKAYQSFDSRLSKVLKTGGEPAFYLGRLRDVVQSAMDDSISASDRAAWSALRKQWAAMKTVEPLVAKATSGDISPAALMGRVTADSSGKARMATGRAGALGDLARIGQRFMKAAPNSGTADRLLVNAAVGGGLYGAQDQGWISPSTAMLVGGGLLANRAGLSALNSRALSAGDSRTLTGLARLMQSAPRALPAAANAMSAPMPINISGGRVATPEDIARDEEIVRRFRAQAGG